MKKLLHIQTDESGYLKSITLDGKVLSDVTEIRLTAEAKQPFIIADLEISPVTTDLRTDVRYVTLVCHICGCQDTHLCNTEQAADHDNTKGH